ncbi:MAG TPA: sulfite exporter TauE/SafE family protein [Acidimicrobiia bacterium]|nr:sulfite exporter TauE/SafE family protein [Acidimicrobiia bacterium]
MSELLVLVTGLGVGLVFGMFGAGGSAFATPLLALVGVPPVVAVASPLPAMLPASAAGARYYLRSGNLDARVARLVVVGGVPGTLLGALASNVVSGQFLLVLSGVMLFAVGARVLMPDTLAGAANAHERIHDRNLIVGSAFAIGFLTGLLANGGGFLLVPLFVIALGMTTARAAGTSMVAVGALTIPTVAAHIALGHVDWVVAVAFAAGLVPGSMFSARFAQRIPTALARRAFGALLVAFSVWFLFHLAF